MSVRHTEKLLLSLLVSALACGGGSDGVTSPVNDPSAVGAITLSDAAVTVEMGFSRQLNATVTSTSGATLGSAPITWSSDNPNVAQVSSGSITPVAAGTTTIRATSGGKTATASVTIIPTVVVSVGLSRKSAILSIGRTLDLVATPLDALDRKISGRAVTFLSSDNLVADVTSAGRVTARSNGDAIITASSDGKSALAQVTVTAPTPVSIVVKGASPSGMQTLSRYSVVMRDDDDSLLAQPSGATGALSGAMLLADSIQFIARGDIASSDDAWPSTLTAARGELPASVPAVFIPRKYTLQSGTFAGVSVLTDMRSATDPCPIKSDQCFTGFYPLYFRSGVVAWSTLPIPVFLLKMTPTDSANLWIALHEMESAVGRQLFVPDDGSSGGRITASIGLPPGSPTGVGGEAQWFTDGRYRITSASVWFVNSILSSAQSKNLVQHEFIHALGFMHTCSWPSVMGGYGCTSTALSANDVAYILLSYSIFDTERSFRLPDGTLPCGAMGVAAAIPGQHAIVSCDGNAWKPFTDFTRLRFTRINSNGSDWRGPIVQ